MIQMTPSSEHSSFKFLLKAAPVSERWLSETIYKVSYFYFSSRRLNICAGAWSGRHTCFHKHLHTCKHRHRSPEQVTSVEPDVTDYHEACVSLMSHLSSLQSSAPPPQLWAQCSLCCDAEDAASLHVFQSNTQILKVFLRLDAGRARWLAKVPKQYVLNGAMWLVAFQQSIHLSSVCRVVTVAVAPAEETMHFENQPSADASFYNFVLG